MKRILIAGNWKMNKSAAEAELFMKSILGELPESECEVLVIPPFTSINAVSKILDGTGIQLGAQNMHWEEKGPYTGEISPSMIKESGCSYVLIGHSERRTLFSETNETCNKKIKSALAHELKPILCIGESLNARESGSAFESLKTQLNESLDGIDLSGKITIAYEPIWAIGSSKPATAEIAQETAFFIREELRKKSHTAADEIRIIYGGSVDESNIAAFLSQPDINGALIGSASLSERFVEIARVGNDSFRNSLN